MSLALAAARVARWKCSIRINFQQRRNAVTHSFRAEDQIARQNRPGRVEQVSSRGFEFALKGGCELRVTVARQVAASNEIASGARGPGSGQTFDRIKRRASQTN